MGLDGGRGASKRHGLDHIRIQGALGQKTNRSDLFGFLFEHPDEFMADDSAFLFRIDHLLQFFQKAGPGLHMDQRDMVMASENLDHFFRLAAPQQSVIDEDTG